MARKIRRQAGDTIIEVLLAVAVVSSVLGITYSIMNRNLLTIRDNQERSEASRLVRGQLEYLKQVAATDGLDALPTNTGEAFCIMDGAEIVPNTSFPNGTATSDPATDNIGAYPSECRSSFYSLAIKRNNSGGYTVSARWDSLTGERGQVVMAYKLQ